MANGFVIRKDLQRNPRLLGELAGVFQQCYDELLGMRNLRIAVGAQPTHVASRDIRSVRLPWTMQRVPRQRAIVSIPVVHSQSGTDDVQSSPARRTLTSRQTEKPRSLRQPSAPAIGDRNEQP